MSVATAWRDMVVFFQLAKSAWRNEERKVILCADEIRKIDELFLELQLIIDSFDQSIYHMEWFMSKQRVLSLLVGEAERKMGYVSVLD